MEHLPGGPGGGRAGANIIWFTFDASEMLEEKGSGPLREYFQASHTYEDTEYAFIHPYDHWFDFTDEHYEIPVTNTAFVCGVYWANYLGSAHLAEFDPKRLDSLATYNAHWQKDRSVCWFSVPELSEATSEEAESNMIELTVVLRGAIRPDSRWAR